MSALKYSYRAGSAAERTLTILRSRSATATQRHLSSRSCIEPPVARTTLSTYSTLSANRRTSGLDLKTTRKQPFSISIARRATVVTQNMRQDEDGKDMLIEITPGAQKRLREIAAKDKNPDLALRVTVQSGGCHGFQYLMSLTNKENFSAEDDTVFETEEQDARVVMDEPSLALLKGSKVDFTMELIGSQFKITGNPAATSSCGCGTSFDIQM